MRTSLRALWILAPLAIFGDACVLQGAPGVDIAQAAPIEERVIEPQLQEDFRDTLSRRSLALAPDARRFAKLIEAVSRAHGVDPALVQAVILVESSYDPNAVSAAGAAGLMQLMPETARRHGVRDIFDPADNIRGGVRHLRELLALFDGDVELAIAAYNAGENAVIRAGYRIPPYRQTEAFVPKVIGHYHRLQPHAVAVRDSTSL